MKNFLALLFVLLLPFSAISEERKLKVVTTFSILEDFANNVGGEKVEVFSLVGKDEDAHVYRPTPSEIKKVTEADVIITNGLGFEGWMSRLTKESAFNGIVVVATSGIKTINTDNEHEEHGHGEIDPHAWHNTENAITYVKNIEKGFASADRKNKKYYEANAEKYINELKKLDREIKEKFAKIPKENKKIVASHDAFAYFARAYGFEFLSPQGVSTASEASAKDVAALIKQIKQHNIKTVFVENISDDRLIKQISDESGANFGGKLYSDALSKDEAASTYIKMMQHNSQKIAQAVNQ